MWKVDFAKAYDSIDQRFLWALMRKRDFPVEWISQVKALPHLFLSLSSSEWVP